MRNLYVVIHSSSGNNVANSPLPSNLAHRTQWLTVLVDRRRHCTFSSLTPQQSDSPSTTSASGVCDTSIPSLHDSSILSLLSGSMFRGFRHQLFLILPIPNCRSLFLGTTSTPVFTWLDLNLGATFNTVYLIARLPQLQSALHNTA